jgi:hypothetical protein
MKMNFKKMLWIGLVLGLLACQKETSTLVPDTNWADVTLEAKGASRNAGGNGIPDSNLRVDSYREAREDLYRKLETEMMNLKIDPKRDVKTFIGQNQKLKEKVSAFLKETRITNAVYTPGKGMELTGQIYLGEGFKSILGLMEKKAPEDRKNTSPQPGSPSGKGF